ncbi:uncharacterized protein LOC119085063 [Bradysia coprophila]|uniref:uncharacterized protein LOC119085063 n=1 Tax=Bradysia coprophila TaxID=38358 RepID=UPI00187DC395|nr:uncharacterized protein LOC119085063 [Bradysia coprophila]
MERNSTEQIAMNNARCVMSAIAQNGSITHNDLLASFAQCTEEPIDQIKHELKHVLSNGVAGGFIVKKGNKYEIPGYDSLYETDADKGCESAAPKTVAFSVEAGSGVEIKISIGTTKGKRKADDEAETCSSTCSVRSTKKKRMYEDDDDGEDFRGFES